MSDIFFHFEDVASKPFPPKKPLQYWLHLLAKSHQSAILTLNYIFCSDEYLLQVNREYLNHDYYTDIITFPFKEGLEVEGDIFVSLDRIRENAVTHEVPFDEELLRVIAHGLLHLIGFDDKSPEKAAEMRIAENEAVALYRTAL